MKPTLNPHKTLCLLIGLVFLAACAPAGSPIPADTSTQTALPAAAPIGTANGPQVFTDPFDYCAIAGTVDRPGPPYTGPKQPEAVVKGLMKASGAAADMPLEVFSQGTFWRCMDQKVYACFVGANLPCESKANTSQEPTAEMNDFCSANPSSDFIPAAVTGHETIYAWSCKDGKAAAGDQVFHVDKQGYIQEIWYEIAP